MSRHHMLSLIDSSAACDLPESICGPSRFSKTESCAADSGHGRTSHHPLQLGKANFVFWSQKFLPFVGSVFALLAKTFNLGN